MNIIEINKDNFDRVIKENSHLLIDFWADWCAPCKSFARVIEKIAPDYPDFIFGSINIEEEKELAQEFHITSIPAVLIMRDQVIVFADSGALTAPSLRNLLDQARKLSPEDLKSPK